MIELFTLRGCILSKYKTIGKFAESAGWSRSKAARIISGQQQPDQDDIYNLVTMLNIDNSDDFSRIFFPTLSTKWTIKKA